VTDRLSQADAEVIGRLERSQAGANELAQPALDDETDLTVWTVTQVSFEIVPLLTTK